MGKTSIEWCDYSWPIVNGCRRVSRGCEQCYAERLTATRLSHTPKYAGLAVYGKNGPRWTGESRLWAKHLDMPFKLKDPSKIFVADMGDLFYENVTNEEIAAVFGVMAANPRHTFQVLTKRPERAREWFKWVKAGASPPKPICGWSARSYLLNAGLPFPPGLNTLADGGDVEWPLPNVWLGCSVEDQATADQRIPELVQLPAAIRFLSVEPLLEAVSLGLHGILPRTITGSAYIPLHNRLDWVIVGGESGPNARPFDIGWARALVRECSTAGVACFIKQLGAKPFSGPRTDAGTGYELDLASRKGGVIDEWPDDLKVREFPEC